MMLTGIAVAAVVLPEQAGAFASLLNRLPQPVDYGLIGLCLASLLIGWRGARKRPQRRQVD